MTRRGEIALAKTGHGDMHYLTSQVTAIVERSQIHVGSIHVF